MNNETRSMTENILTDRNFITYTKNETSKFFHLLKYKFKQFFTLLLPLLKPDHYTTLFVVLSLHNIKPILRMNNKA